MASVKTEKPAGTQLFGQVKKEPAKSTDNAAKAPASKSGAKKAAQKPQEPKKKGKGGKSASKH
ncbi:hypothetical protein RGQ29_015013 [Quercus rubra]|uniref:Uncharacterized protein n=1 Tax=Quercus rubra TaxID=3512 RepID=A0AAN7J3V3_QUERU|nr:hypothetical protein RGQ29_015013 [Quercus rubra]